MSSRSELSWRKEYRHGRRLPGGKERIDMAYDVLRSYLLLHGSGFLRIARNENAGKNDSGKSPSIKEDCINFQTT